jgi:ABC-type transport system involved in multi-copper enzyme maturation permease subunit
MAIHEQNYARYEGPLNQGGAWMTFARTTFRLAMSFKRTWAMLVLLWIPVLFTVVAIFIEYGVREKIPQAQAVMETGGISAMGVTTVLLMQFFSAALLMMVSGCGAISDDLRYRTFQLYFSRPVEPWEYLLGKFMGVAALCSLVTVVPALLLGGLRAAYFARTGLASVMFEQSAVAVAVSFGVMALVSCIVLGLSSLTRRTGYAVLGFVGILFVPQVLSIVVAIADSGDSMSHLWSLGGNIWLITQLLLAETPPDIPIVAPLAILLAVGGLGIYAMYWRVHKLEGVA